MSLGGFILSWLGAAIPIPIPAGGSCICVTQNFGFAVAPSRLLDSSIESSPSQPLSNHHNTHNHGSQASRRLAPLLQPHHWRLQRLCCLRERPHRAQRHCFRRQSPSCLGRPRLFAHMNQVAVAFLATGFAEAILWSVNRVLWLGAHTDSHQPPVIDQASRSRRARRRAE